MGLFDWIKKNDERCSSLSKLKNECTYCPLCRKQIQKERKVCPYCGNALSNKIVSVELSQPDEQVILDTRKEDVKPTLPILAGMVIDDNTIGRDIDKENTVVEFEYLEKPPKGVILPKELVDKLPDSERIKIISFSNNSNSVGRRYRLALNNESNTEDFIQYCGKSIPEMSYDKKHAERINLYADSFHPFFSQFTNDVTDCIKKMLMHASYLPSLYEVSNGTLCVNLDSGYHTSGYKETSEYFCYRDSYQESTHDGGGSGLEKWYIYPAETVVCKTELTEEIGYKNFSSLPRFVHLPYCRGFWTENEHVYLVDPWGLSGIFEYFCHAEEQSDYNSDNKIWDIGVPCDK